MSIVFLAYPPTQVRLTDPDGVYLNQCERENDGRIQLIIVGEIAELEEYITEASKWMGRKYAFESSGRMTAFKPEDQPELDRRGFHSIILREVL